MMIYLATDHRGYELKEKIKKWLSQWGFEFEDCGAFEFNPEDDYPDFISKAAQKVSEDTENNKAVVLGGSGQGEAMVANKFKGVRAVVFYTPAKTDHNENVIKLSREHNNANVLALGASFLDEDTTKNAIKLWLETPFSDEERHKRRIEKINVIEN
ncbi:MAG: RpiB/LacA/LacB family sugar-phosphate isomerase [Parcubacteria group bacterium]|nr:RpiB/LacA/LacB family sugar-phosphate isomerase [Parcubacteria group bacterium]